MKNLENKIKSLNENRGEISLYEYVYAESQSDPNFFRWLFDEEFDNDFDSSLSDDQTAEFNTWLEEIRVEDLFEKYIVVSFDADTEDRIRITKRSNFEKMDFCKAYGNYGVQVDCNNAGCYSFNNTDSCIFSDFYSEASEMFGFNEDVLDKLELSHRSLYEMLIEPSGSVAYRIMKDEITEWDKVIEFFNKWREENETHTEVTAWTYHDSHNFKTVVLDTDFGEPDCVELDEDEQKKIFAEYPGVPHIEGTNASEETENYIFHFDLWATNPWVCYVEKK